MWRTKNAEEWVANGEHKEIFRKRETDTYAEWIKSETMNPKTQKCLKHRDLCRNITLCTASASSDSHSLSGQLMTGSLYNTSTWHIPGHFVLTASQWSRAAHPNTAGMEKEGAESLGAAALSKLVHFGMFFQLKVMSNSDGIYFALSRRTGHYLDKTTEFWISKVAI